MRTNYRALRQCTSGQSRPGEAYILLYRYNSDPQATGIVMYAAKAFCKPFRHRLVRAEPH